MRYCMYSCWLGYHLATFWFALNILKYDWLPNQLELSVLLCRKEFNWEEPPTQRPSVLSVTQRYLYNAKQEHERQAEHRSSGMLTTKRCSRPGSFKNLGIFAHIKCIHPVAVGQECPRIAENASLHICRWHHIVMPRGWSLCIITSFGMGSEA